MIIELKEVHQLNSRASEVVEEVAFPDFPIESVDALKSLEATVNSAKGYQDYVKIVKKVHNDAELFQKKTKNELEASMKRLFDDSVFKNVFWRPSNRVKEADCLIASNMVIFNKCLPGFKIFN